MKRIICCILICISIPFLKGQSSRIHFEPSFFEKQEFAHRGGYAIGPENTLKTVLANIQNNVSAIEVDVMMTKDKQLVLFHDQTVERVLEVDEPKLFSEYTYDEIKKIPLRDKSQGKQYVASLRELLDTLTILIPKKDSKDFILELDFKPHGEQTEPAVKLLETILQEELKNHGQVLYNYFFVSSFYPEVLKEINSVDPKIKTAFGVNNSPFKYKFKARLAILFAPKIIKKFGVSIIEPNICMVTEKFVRKWHKRGILINAYTANTQCEKEHLKKFQLAITTNCPDKTCQPDPSDEIGKPKKWCKKCR